MLTTFTSPPSRFFIGFGSALVALVVVPIGLVHDGHCLLGPEGFCLELGKCHPMVVSINEHLLLALEWKRSGVGLLEIVLVSFGPMIPASNAIKL